MLSAVPLAGSRFDGWAGDCAAFACTLEMTDDRAVSAAFTNVRSWVRSFGSTEDDVGMGLDYANSGDLIVAGSFAGTITIGTETLVSAGPKSDVFVAKFTPSGMVAWAKRFGGPGDDEAVAVAVSKNGTESVYVTGSFEDAVDFGGGTITASGGSDAFLVFLTNGDGSHVASRGIGGSGDDEGRSVVVDGSGDVLVAGAFRSTVDFGSGTAVSSNGMDDIFIAKYVGTDLDYIWANAYGSGNTDAANAVGVDAAGNVYVTGHFGGSLDVGAAQPLLSSGATDIFLLALTSAGAHQWSARFGGLGFEAGHAIHVDRTTGALTVGGSFSSPIAFGQMVPALTPMGQDGFVLTMTAGGSYVWARRLGGPGVDSVTSVTAGGGVVFAVGTFEQEIDLGAGSHSGAGGTDLFLVKLAGADGATAWSNAAGGSGDDAATAAQVNAVGQLSVTGSFIGDVDLGEGVASGSGMRDGFVFKYVP